MFGLKHRNELPPAVARELDQLLASLRAFLSVSFDDDGTLTVQTTATVSEIGFPVGSIIAYGAATAPDGWLVCDGSAISRATYVDLFDVIGITYGPGNGSTTFNIPDLRGRFPIGKAASGTGSTLGGTGGAIDHTHTGPSHTHAVTGITVGTPSATTDVQSGAGSTVASSTHTHALGGTADAAGAGNTGTGNPPFQAVTYLILVQ
jgi:microcystin-dependent protein